MDFCRSKGEQKAQTSAESMVESVTGHPMAGCSEEEAAGFLGT
jgi:prephenate dehydrogenase